MFIVPDKIYVGFNKRSDVSGRGLLGYVTYYDDKGKLRKSDSVNSWRDDSIPAEEYSNEPVSGFLVNKKVGEERYSWDPRRAWVRITDPRGFDFEISVDNLIFIMKNLSVIRDDKEDETRIDGALSYAFDGSKLILLPAKSVEYYEASKSFDSAKSGCVKSSDLVVGRTYINKKGQHVVYLGKLHENGYPASSKNFWFCYINEKSYWKSHPYWIYSKKTLGNHIVREASHGNSLDYESIKKELDCSEEFNEIVTTENIYYSRDEFLNLVKEKLQLDDNGESKQCYTDFYCKCTINDDNEVYALNFTAGRYRRGLSVEVYKSVKAISEFGSISFSKRVVYSVQDDPNPNYKKLVNDVLDRVHPYYVKMTTSEGNVIRPTKIYVE